MYGYIYETINLINGKKYIGKHKSSKFDENYYGSGVALRKALTKYGIENFKVRLLEEINTNQKDLDELETYFIKKFNAVKDKNYYNRSYGGESEGWHGYNKAIKEIGISDELRAKMSNSQKERFKNPKERAKTHKAGFKHTDITKKKMSDSAKKRWNNPKLREEQSKRFSGKNNPMYHRCLVDNPASVKCRFIHNDVIKDFKCLNDLYNYCNELGYNLKYTTITGLTKTGKPYIPRYKRHEKARGLIIQRLDKELVIVEDHILYK